MTIRALWVGLVAAGLLAAGIRAAEGWETDWAKAKAAAARDGKTILIEFTGSDWCGWCIKLNKEVLSQAPFTAYADVHVVLMEADYPRKKEQSAELREQNRRLQQEFNVNVFPSVFLLDPEGTPFARTGYRDGGAEAYVAHLKELMAIRAKRDEALARAKAAQGLERARCLVAALDPVPVTLLGFYGGITKEIQALDKENQTGFRSRLLELELVTMDDKVRRLSLAGRRDEALASVDTFITANHLTGELQQKALLTKLKAYPPSSLGNLAAAEALIDQIVAIDGATATATQCATTRGRLAKTRQHLIEKTAGRTATP